MMLPIRLAPTFPPKLDCTAVSEHGTKSSCGGEYAPR